VTLVAIAALGPRVRVSVPAWHGTIAGDSVVNGMPTWPDSLAAWPAYLATRERNAGVTDTAVARRVKFANAAAPSRTTWAVVYLHGFSATRQETAPLAEQVAARLGANLFDTRLRGHGLPGDSLHDVRAGEWLVDAAEALAIGRRLGDSVLVIATSTGGTLAAWLATLPPSERRGFAKLVLISPNFGPRNRASALLSVPWTHLFLPRILGDRSWTPRNALQARYWTVRYPTTVLYEMQALVTFVRDRPVTGWDIPTLVFYHRNDNVVDASETIAWLDALQRETKAPVERVEVIPREGEDGHVIVGHAVAPSQVDAFRERVMRFVGGASK
jgi:esterase/lipase